MLFSRQIHRKEDFKSYSQVIAAALVDYFDRYYKNREDPYLETREREEQFVQQIVSAVEKSMEKALPVFLAGCMAGLSKSDAAVPPAESPATDPDADVDWDFLGE